ncbi:Fibronectin type III domain protein [Reticulomyxa filosa]|uniref:Fibronectin type III domain protein n=1 Tax=Reticulomyxa filosa TaxID=46433 RepID=X6LDR2_RETFI|nr:Fibronectin type III domain protein [Reticulomyxa filosa]|eukprot:ETN99693.1 Fibronectin type III domain protein [Reticulomyxa filosa]
MLSFIQSSNLKNGVDFLLITENQQTIQLKNNEWNDYNFGIFLLGENTTLTLNCNRYKKELGHLKIKTSHLWIKHSSSKIDCSKLGYPMNQGPGKGNSLRGGGGYGTKGGGYDGQCGEMYGEETLLKKIHFGSGGYGYGGSGGGIIELIIEQQLINHGSIQSNGKNAYNYGGGGSGGSILIEFQCQSHSNKLKQTVGTITCIGGSGRYNGGDGRIAIYGIELSSDDILAIDPKPWKLKYFEMQIE